MHMLKDCNRVGKCWGTPKECNEKQGVCMIWRVGFWFLEWCCKRSGQNRLIIIDTTFEKEGKV